VEGLACFKLPGSISDAFTLHSFTTNPFHIHSYSDTLQERIIDLNENFSGYVWHFDSLSRFNQHSYLLVHSNIALTPTNGILVFLPVGNIFVLCENENCQVFSLPDILNLGLLFYCYGLRFPHSQVSSVPVLDRSCS
jgi:hypothetical protein